jgi:hypothetical protein
MITKNGQVFVWRKVWHVFRHYLEIQRCHLTLELFTSVVDQMASVIVVTVRWSEHVLVNGEQYELRTSMSWPISRYYHGVRLDILRKTMNICVRLFGRPVEIRIFVKYNGEKKRRKKRQEDHVACRVVKINSHKILVPKHEGKNHLYYTDIHGNVMLTLLSG